MSKKKTLSNIKLIAILLSISFFISIIGSCQKVNPFGDEKYTYEGTFTLGLGEGYNFNTRGQALHDGDGDIYFYKAESKFVLGIGWDSSTALTPNTDVIANLQMPLSEFENIRRVPISESECVAAEEIRASEISSNALYLIFTREKTFSLIGITQFNTNSGSESITLKYIYNPNSSTDNPNLYTTY